jgi:hypothetical protein
MSKLTVSTAAAEAHAKLINEAWQKTVPAIVETGKRIIEARAKLGRGERTWSRPCSTAGGLQHIA